jgi:adenylate kinase
MLKIIIAGAPASGKGTQCELIVQKYGVVHISTGDVLRAQVAANTALGIQAKECMDKGALVPDDLIISIVKERLAEEDCQSKGWLLDGFPRTGVQAEALKAAGITPTHFILLDVPDSILVERCVGRRSDPQTGKIYHLKFNPPPEDPDLLARLVHRSDDTAEAMGKRIKMYHDNVNAIIGFYSHVKRNFDGTVDKMNIFAEVSDFLEGRKKTLRIIIAGAPASGKGTQCELIVQKYGVVHISTGDVLRAQVAANTALGIQAKECMDKGALVPDDLIISIVKERLAEEDCQSKGWLLDGFPRTGVQAEALKAAGITPTHFILLDVPDSILVERCVGRRSDPQTGKIYHLKFNPPPEDPDLLARLVHRSDDTAEAMGKRIKMYHDNVDSVIGFYEHICQRFDGTAEKRLVSERAIAFLGGRFRPVKSGPRLIIAGPPASGKGTQCEELVKEFGVVHISTGDVLREQVAQGTELGRLAKECMDRGGLVPDHVMVGIVRARLGHQDCRERGWLLDGFPRTGPQACPPHSPVLAPLPAPDPRLAGPPDPRLAGPPLTGWRYVCSSAAGRQLKGSPAGAGRCTAAAVDVQL